MADDAYFDQLAQSWEEEGFFARDMQGRLIRVVAATAKDYDERVTVTIDGRDVQVPRAVPAADAQGNLLLDADGRTIPRKTTIYDAAVALFRRDNPRAAIPIPTLCHAEHLRPVGVCRVCSVEVARWEPDPRDPTKRREVGSAKLVPACVQPVEPSMIVHTMESPGEKPAARVRSCVKVLLELLAADHLPELPAPADSAKAQPAATAKDDDASPPSEFAALVARLEPQLGLDRARLASPTPPRFAPDHSSPLIDVNPTACILCDRCSRACNEVKENLVIGRTGKGYSARVGFDLNDPLGASSCVACGECMLSCPTDALTFRQPIISEWHEQTTALPGRAAVAPAELEGHPLLGALPFRFRQWNQSSIVRWRVRAGDELCRLGDYGTTAFILNRGRFGIFARDGRVNASSTSRGGWFRWWRGAATANEGVELGTPDAVATPDDVVLGEMTCMSHFPRTATIVALEEGEVFEVRRNVLFALQRNPQARQILDRVYRQRALRRHLDSVSFFADLTADERDACRDFLRDRVQLVRVDPGQVVFRQGEAVDAFYMVRLGYVAFKQTFAGQERIVNYFGPNRHFGEIGIMAEMPQFASLVPTELARRRTATCVALDDVELVRIDKRDFIEMLLRFRKLLDRFGTSARELLAPRQQQSPDPVDTLTLAAFTDQGLYNAQRLLAIDLEACTRCDECAKACADTHGGVTRLIRDGQRLGQWLVASSCRSCSDPYCLVGCPVDAIHRHGQRKEIVIESHCIGCGLCASHCPYGNINLHGVEQVRPDPRRPGQTYRVIQQQATTCDLCANVVGAGETVSCVHACPHHAAFRLSGEELLRLVRRETGL